MKRKINVAVLMGGKSPEHEISLISGLEVAQRLDPKKYNVFPVIISRNGQNWNLLSVRQLLTLPDPLSLKHTNKEIVRTTKYEIENVSAMKEKRINVVFIAMHGPYGEDGTIQGMLDLAGLKYTGSGVLASAIGMDKVVFAQLMAANGILTPRKVKGPPCFIKPSDQGSSVGASIAKNNKEFKEALSLAKKYSKKVLIEEYIEGKELTCAVLGNENPVALPVIEILPKKGKFFDYDSKYLEGGSDEIVPAKISKRLTKKVQDIAVRVHNIVGCRGFSRVDFIVRKGGIPIVLEINTIPGLTPMSLLPKAAKAAGISYKKLIDKIISYSIGA